MPRTPLPPRDAEQAERLAAFLAAVDDDRVDDLLDAAFPALYRRERHGVRTVAVRGASVGVDGARRVDTYRLAQYLRIGFVDPDRVVGADGPPATPFSPDDVYVLAADDEGRVLCSVVLRALPHVADTVRLGDRDRPLFPVEQAHGVGVFDRLRVLPDLPAARVRELGWFVKNQTLEPLGEALLRAPVEVGVAVFRLLATTLSWEVNALVGDLEPTVAKNNLDFFGGRLVVLPATVPYLPETSYLVPRYEQRTVCPFALLTADSAQSVDRLARIEAALELPGQQGLAALLALKQDVEPGTWSTLTPGEAAAALVNTPVAHQDVPMHSRRLVLARAQRVQRFAPLAGLSRGEAVALASCLIEVEVDTGEVVIRHGEPGDALYFVESGEAVAFVTHADGDPHEVGRFTAGDYFGEVGVLLGGRRTAHVIAATPLRLLRLSGDDYRRYLLAIAAIDGELTRTAMSRVLGRI